MGALICLAKLGTHLVRAPVYAIAWRRKCPSAALDPRDPAANRAVPAAVAWPAQGPPAAAPAHAPQEAAQKRRIQDGFTRPALKQN